MAYPTFFVRALCFVPALCFCAAAFAQDSSDFKDGYAQGYKEGFDAGYRKAAAEQRNAAEITYMCGAVAKTASAYEHRAAYLYCD